MADPADSRTRMLDATSDLLQRRGYFGTGLNEVLATGRAPKGSLYFHFPGGKEQLAAEALERSGHRFAAGIEAALDAHPDTASAVAAIAEALAAGLEATSFERGCPIATAALETAATSDNLRAACDESFAAWLAALERKLRADGRGAEEARSLALLVLSGIEGALVLARARRHAEPVRTVAAQLVQVLERRDPS